MLPVNNICDGQSAARQRSRRGEFRGRGRLWRTSTEADVQDRRYRKRSESLSRVESASLQRIVRDLGDSFPAWSTPSAAGNPRIVRTRIPIWILADAAVGRAKPTSRELSHARAEDLATAPMLALTGRDRTAGRKTRRPERWRGQPTRTSCYAGWGKYAKRYAEIQTSSWPLMCEVLPDSSP